MGICAKKKPGCMTRITVQREGCPTQNHNAEKIHFSVKNVLRLSVAMGRSPFTGGAEVLLGRGTGRQAMLERIGMRKRIEVQLAGCAR
jgi:hypothetical protein